MYESYYFGVIGPGLLNQVPTLRVRGVSGFGKRLAYGPEFFVLGSGRFRKWVWCLRGLRLKGFAHSESHVASPLPLKPSTSASHKP